MYILKQNKAPKRTTKLRQNDISKSLHQLFPSTLISHVVSQSYLWMIYTGRREGAQTHRREHQWLRLSLLHVIVLHLVYTGDWTQWPSPLINGNDFPPSVVIPSFRSSDTCASSFLRKASKVRELPLFVAILAIFVVVSCSISKDMVLTKILISSFSEAEVSTLAVVFPVTVPLNSPLASIHSFKNIN